MKINIELSENDLLNLILDYLEETFNHTIDKSKLHIEVKSKQNYRSEWEHASFRASYKE